MERRSCTPPPIPFICHPRNPVVFEDNAACIRCQTIPSMRSESSHRHQALLAQRYGQMGTYQTVKYAGRKCGGALTKSLAGLFLQHRRYLEGRFRSKRQHRRHAPFKESKAWYFHLPGCPSHPYCSRCRAVGIQGDHCSWGSERGGLVTDLVPALG